MNTETLAQRVRDVKSELQAATGKLLVVQQEYDENAERAQREI